MSVATTSMAARPMPWSLTVASDYEFLPEGVRVFKGHFDMIMRERSIFAKVDYRHASHSFEIDCYFPDSKTVSGIAHEIYVNLIITERGDDVDDLKSNLIANLVPDPVKKEKRAEIVEELISLDFKSVWKCSTQDLSMDQVIPKYVQLSIESITSTNLVEDLNEQTIQVHAQCQEDCDRVLRKLDVLRKYHDLASRHIHHLFLTEGEDNFELGVRFFIEIEQKLVQTTLLDPLYASLRFEGLIKACKVRCFPFVPIRNAYLLKSGDKLVPAVPEKDKKKRGMDFDLWLGYNYQGKGGEHLKRIGGKQFQLPPLEPLETGEQVRKWLATGIPDDPNESIEQMREDLRKAAEFGNSSSDNPKDPYFANTFLQEKELSLFKPPARESLDSVSNNPPTLRPTIETKGDFLGIPANRQSIYRSPAMRDLRTGNRTGSENVRGPRLIQSLLDSDIQDDERLHLANIVVSQPLRAVPSSVVKKISNNYGLQSVRGPRFQQLLLDSDIPECESRDLRPSNDGISPGCNLTPDPTLPTILEEAGVNSLVSNWTMNQGVPELAARDEEDRSEAPLLSPALVAFADLNLKNSTKEFDDEMEANVNMILESIRNYHGEIRLECHFGRALMKPFGPSIMRSLEKAHSIPVQHMADLLLTNPKNLGFTKSITTLAADVQFLLDMRIEETSQKIWSDSAEWTVKYEYICCDHEDYDGKCATGFIMEMDADSFETNVKSVPLNFGNLNVHCTKRNWDYMISANGLQNLDEDYGSLVQAIKESTYIAPGCPTVSMSFELNHRHQIHFQNIRVRRHSRYKSYDRKTTLNIMEVHDLDFDWEEGEDATTYFVTSSEKPNSIWYEASLESVEARVAFKENLNIELGEETKWTAESLLQYGVVLKDICVPANYIIAKMDGVGFYNDNGTKQLLAAAESTALKKLPHELKAGFKYW